MSINYMIKKFLKIFLCLLPFAIRRWLMKVYGYFIPAQKSYSQKGEDLLLQVYFGREFKGYYLDIGAFHPTWISNTFLLHKNGWKGTVVDLDRYKVEAFKKSRGAAVSTVVAGVVGEQGGKVVPVYKFRSRLGWSDLDTLDVATAEEYVKKGRGSFTIEEVETKLINEILSTLPHVDFLNIDIEGLDVSVLRSIDLDRYRIQVILFEDNGAKNGGHSEGADYLEKKGYEMLFRSGGSLCFFRSNF